MNSGSTRRRKNRLPKLERLLLDADVKATLERYLVAVGFDVVFAVRQRINVRDDVAVAKWARKHRRILITHDRFKDGKTKVRLFQELATRGGRAIQIHGGPDQPVLTSLGKILVNRTQWVGWFSQNKHGLVRLSSRDAKFFNQHQLRRQIQASLDITLPPIVASTPTSRRRTVRPSQQPLKQGQLDLSNGVSKV